MRSTRRPGTARPAWGRTFGYGGAVLLVVAAVVVLLMPLFDKKGDASNAADRGAVTPQATPSSADVPATGPVPSTTPSNATPQQNGTGRRSSDQGQTTRGSGPQLPQQNSGTSLTWCPAGTAIYRPAQGAVEVVVNVSASGFVRAEVALRTGDSEDAQATVTGGKPHTFRFARISVAQVERVKVTTVSTGASMQACYARPGV